MTNFEIFKKSTPFLINPTATKKYLSVLGSEMGTNKTEEVIGKLIENYKNSNDVPIKKDSSPTDFALYINLIVNY